MTQQQSPRVLHVHVPFHGRFEQIAERRHHRDHPAQDERAPSVHEAGLVERDPRDEDHDRRTGHESLPRLARGDRGSHLVTPQEPPCAVRGRIPGEHREQHRERSQPPVGRDVPQQEEMREPEPDPPGAEHGDRHGDRRRLPRAAEALDQEGQGQGRHEAGHGPVELSERSSQEAGQRTEIAGQHDRPQGPSHPEELVQRDHRGDRDQPEEPPAAQVDEPEDNRQPDDRDHDPRQESAHRPPKRRCRCAYSVTARRRSSSPKSGQSRSTNTSSA